VILTNIKNANNCPQVLYAIFVTQNKFEIVGEG